MNKYFKTTSSKPEETKNDDPFKKSPQPCQFRDDKRALTNYSNWLYERHAIHNKLGKKLLRQSGELLMNIADESNQVKEEKKALEYTRITQHFDKYRGNPEWWEFPPGLHDKCSHRRDKVTHFYQKTQAQKNEIPKIEKVGMPGFIKNEKMIFPRTRSVYHQWQNSNYRKQRVEELSSLLENIEPHKPDFDRLIVMGKYAKEKQEETQTITVASRSSSAIIDPKRKTSVYDSSLKCCLKVNGVYFYQHSPSLATSRKFHVLFEYDVQSLPLQTQYISFENVGRVTIRLTWHKMKKFKLFRDITKTDNTEFFCFDKNMMILVPGQIVNFPIWFQTNKVCTVVETWEIKTIPKFWPDAIKVFFVLQAQSHIENFMKRIRTIKSHINQRVKYRIIRETLEDLTVKTKYPSHKNTDYCYYEPELFEATNFDDSKPVRKPKYLYDKAIVEQLKKFYADVRQPYHPKSWNLNVGDLQLIARVKDLIEYAEIRTAEFSQYRVMMASKSFTVDEKKSKSTLEFKLSRSKVSSGSEIEDQSDSFTIKETRYAQLMKLLWKLAPPSITSNEDRLKYFQVYSIFCAYFTLISLELSSIKVFSSNETNQNSIENSQRLIFEKFDDTQMIRTKRTLQEDMTAQPKPEKLLDLSLTDVQTMHKLYFASSSSEYIFDKEKGKLEKTVKKKNKEDLRISKGKPSRLPSNLSRSTFEDVGLVKLDFDPYEEILPVAATKRAIPSPEEAEIDVVFSKELSTIESQNIYVTIYTYLSKAVEAMVDCLESAREYRVPHENLEQLKAFFKLFLEEEASPEEKQRPVNPFTNPEEHDYFEKILGAHLNEVTGQYLICGKTEPVSKERHPVTYWSGEQRREVTYLPEASSAFSLYERVPDEVCFEEREAQTLPYVETKENDTVSFDSKDIICECPSEFRYSPPPICDLFYYSDDEVFEESNVNSGVFFGVRRDSSDEGMPVKEPKKKPAMSRQSLSLIKEWNKKQSSRNELDGKEDNKK